MTTTDRDAGLRHVNERQPGDPGPDRSNYRYCGRPIEREPDSDEWAVAQLAGLDPNPQCPQAPNPDEGPMPGHRPRDFIVHPPAEQ